MIRVRIAWGVAAAAVALVLGFSVAGPWLPETLDPGLAFLAVTSISVIVYTLLTFIGLEQARMADDARAVRERDGWAWAILAELVRVRKDLTRFETDPQTKSPKTPILNRGLDHAGSFPPAIAYKMSLLSNGLDRLSETIAHRSTEGSTRIQETARDVKTTTDDLYDDLDRLTDPGLWSSSDPCERLSPTQPPPHKKKAP